jgi:uncharacterized RDD family membrane protein YckC
MALLCRGGLVLRALGLAVVRHDGKRASRLRVFWRGVIAWAPFFLVPVLGSLLTPLIRQFAAVLGPVVLALGPTVWSLASPERSLQDRLAGTCLGPR